MKRDQGAERCVKAGSIVRLCFGSRAGCAIRLPADAQQSSHGEDHDIGRKVGGVRTGEAEAGDGGVDELGVGFQEGGLGEPERVHVPRRQVLQQHVRAGHEVEEEPATGRCSRVQGDAPLVGIEAGEPEASFRVWQVVLEGRKTPRGIAIGSLHLDDVCSGVRQHLAAEGAGLSRHVEHPVMGEWSHLVTPNTALTLILSQEGEGIEKEGKGNLNYNSRGDSNRGVIDGAVGTNGDRP